MQKQPKQLLHVSSLLNITINSAISQTFTHTPTMTTYDHNT